MARKNFDELNKLKAYAAELGYVWSTSSRHNRFDHPSGATVFSSLSPSCARAWKNARADLKRALNRA